MNLNLQICNLRVRRSIGAVALLACMLSGLAIAGDAPKRELSASEPRAHAPAGADAGTSAQTSLERLLMESALVDTSAFGQLNLLRGAKAKAEVQRPKGSGAKEHCR